MANLQDNKKKITIDQVSGMDFQEFTETFASIIELTPLVAATVWSSKPFGSLSSLHEAFANFIQRDLFPAARAGIIRCYPDLAGKLADSDRLSEASSREHKVAGLLELSDSEKKDLSSLNERYKKKFRFPFVICARENKKESIFAGLKARICNELEVEVGIALNEISKIGWYRLNEIVSNERDSNV